MIDSGQDAGLQTRVMAGAMDITSLLAKYDKPVPRYTSYPTAPHFTGAVDGAVTAGWLGQLPDNEALSLYLHVPFCEELCLYCGCNTAVVRKDGPRRSYAALLAAEIKLAAAAIGRRLQVCEIHWGGGTPTALPADCLTDIMQTLHEAFAIRPDAEISVELDPRHVPQDRLDALQAMGVTRASLGVQDLDPVVQRAVGRVQPLAMVADCVARLRGIGVKSINLDLIYGLPHQTEPGVIETVRQVAGLRADRIAGFGYAHVPWMKRHQALLPEDALPDAPARYAQREAMANSLIAAGYRAVGLDHFALPADPLAQAAASGTLHRNFQGYTTDSAGALLGFGASAIGNLPQGYAQNASSVPDYAAAVKSGRLPTCRGFALSADDRLRRDIIQAIMCGGGVDLFDVARSHAADPAPLLEDAAGLRDFADDGLVELNHGQVRVTGPGRPFLRSIAAIFDVYRAGGIGRHASAV